MPTPRVVIVGAGFGGLTCARALANRPVSVTLIDRNNFHLFTPLLYQVASSLLNPSDIAFPIRSIFRRARNVRCRLGEVVSVDLGARRVSLRDGSTIPYDRLVIAVGSETNFFGIPRLERRAIGLKEMPDAIAIRNQVLACFELASAEADAVRRRRFLTFVIVGGGPTGIEYAGALAELIRFELKRDYREIDVSEVRIILLEATDRLLTAFSASLGEEARRVLERRGIDVRLGARVRSVEDGTIRLDDGEEIRGATLIWAAGVRPAPFAATPPLPTTPSGRIEVDERLRVRGLDDVFAIGDVAGARAEGSELPMLSPAAMQAARYVAGLILAEASEGTGREPEPFLYRDKGIMATIGRNAAVAERGRLRLRGFPGWLAWLALHLWFIIGIRNRVWILASWAWSYLLFHRPIRLILQSAGSGADVRLAGVAPGERPEPEEARATAARGGGR